MQDLQSLITGILMTIMSFLGWNEDTYKETLPNTVEQVTENIQKTLDDFKAVEQPLEPEVAKSVPKPSTITPITTLPPKNSTPTTPLPQTNTKPVQQIETPPQTKIFSTEEKIKASVGNLFCTIIKNNRIEKRTGSVVAISNNGVLLTNAHVAEHLMLSQTSDNTQTCRIRTGSPAVEAYTAKVVYLPSEWIYANKGNLKYQSVQGTGENDFALIVLEDKIRSSASNLSFLKPKSNTFSKGDNIILSGYPAFNGNILDKALYNVTSHSSVSNVWGIGKSDSDLVDTKETILAVEGSSGGAVADRDGNLVGIIVATTVDQNTRKPSIRFISYNYIEKEIKSKTGKSIEDFIENASEFAKEFETKEAPRLSQVLQN